HDCTQSLERVRSTGAIHLLLGFGRAEALAVEAGRVEAANPLLPGSQHVACIVDPGLASLCLLRRFDPVYPVEPGNRRRGVPCRFRFRRSHERFLEVSGQLRFRLFRNGCDLHSGRLAHFRPGSFSQRLVDLQPVAEPTIRLERYLKWATIERAFDGRPTATRKLLAYRL